MQKKHVFVYGTLKSSHGNNRLLGDSRLMGEAVTEKEFLLTTIGFPYMIPKDSIQGYETHPVLGEVYEVDDPDVMKSLDRLEGVDSGHYEHHTMRATLQETGETIEVQAYVPCNKESAASYASCQTINIFDQTVYVY